MAPIVVNDGRAELAFSLPSGPRYVMSYPEPLQLAALGATTAVTVDWVGAAEVSANETCCERQVRFRYATPDELFPGIAAERLGTSAPRVVNREPSVEAGLSDPMGAGWVIIPVERWSAVFEVAVESQGFAPISESEQERFTRAFQATIQPDYFPVFRLGGPFNVQADTASITFGSFDADDGPKLILTPFYCGKPGSNTSVRRHSQLNSVSSVVWCESSTGLFVWPTGPQPFVDAIAEGLATRLG